MHQAESIFVHDGIMDQNTHHLQSKAPTHMYNHRTDRIKMGEVFQVQKNQYAFVCVHCGREFQSFPKFTLHIQQHYQSVFRWQTNASIKTEAEASEEITVGMNINEMSSYFADSDDDGSTFGDNSYDPPENELNPYSDNADDDDNDNNDDLTIRPSEFKALFNLRHHAIKVNNSPELRKLLPYFANGYFFKRENGRVVCPICKQLYSGQLAVRTHIFTHSRVKPFWCGQCGKKFITPKSIRRHMVLKHGDHDDEAIGDAAEEEMKPKPQVVKFDPCKCTQCGLDFTSKMSLDIHMQFHSGSSKVLMCHQCGWASESQQSLKEHMDAHAKETTAQCHICNKMVAKQYLSKHISRHTCERNHQCFVCGARFTRSDHLQRHALVHGADPKYKCDVCDMLFVRSDKLLAHRRKHDESMNFTCGLCGKGFFELNSMKKHEVLHVKGRLSVSAVLKTEKEEGPRNDFGQQIADGQRIADNQGIESDQRIEGGQQIENSQQNEGPQRIEEIPTIPNAEHIDEKEHENVEGNGENCEKMEEI